MKTFVLLVLSLAFAYCGEPARGEVHRKAYSGTPDQTKTPDVKKAAGKSGGLTVGLATKATEKAPTIASVAKKEAGQGSATEPNPSAAAPDAPTGKDGKVAKTKKYADGGGVLYTNAGDLDKGARARCKRTKEGLSINRKGQTANVPIVPAGPIIARAGHLEQNVNYARAHGLNSTDEAKNVIGVALNRSFRNFVQPDNEMYYYYTSEADRRAALNKQDFLVEKMAIEALGGVDPNNVPVGTEFDCNLAVGGGGGGDAAKASTDDGKGAGGAPLQAAPAKANDPKGQAPNKGQPQKSNV